MDEILQQLLQSQNPNLQDIGDIPRPTSSQVGNLLKGVPAGLAGMPVDIVSAMMRPLGYDTPPNKTVGSAEWFGELMGADTESGPFLAGQFLSPDPLDAVKAAGLLGSIGQRFGPDIAAEMDKISRKRKALDDYEKDVKFVEADTVDPKVDARIKTTGQYRGAPRGVDKPQKLGKLRRNLANLLEEGAPGRDWYSQSAESTNQLTGDRRNYKHLLAGSSAITSRGVSVPVNQGFGVKGYNQAITGRPAVTGRFPKSQGEAIDTLASGNTYFGGPKETPFYEGLTIDERAAGIRPTNDLWMARAFNYLTERGDEWSAGLGKAQHRFMDKEINRLVKAANEAELGGFADWTPEKVQASIWVAQKAKTEGTTVAKAATDFSHNLDNLTANIRYEANPSKSLDHLPGISTGEGYADIVRAVTQDPQGRDLLALETGALTRPSDTGFGIYEGDLSPSTGARILAGAETGSPVTDEASMALAKGIGAGRGMNLGQDTVGITTFRPVAKAGDRNIARITDDTLTPERLRDVESALLERFGGEAFPVHSPDGFEVLYMGDDGADFTKGIKEALGRKDIEFGRNSGDLVGNMGEFKPSAYMKEIDEAGLGTALPRLEKGARDEAAALQAADKVLSESVPEAGARSELLSKTRQILIKDGFEGIRKAVEAGILPVAVLGIAGTLMTGQDDGNIR